MLQNPFPKKSTPESAAADSPPPPGGQVRRTEISPVRVLMPLAEPCADEDVGAPRVPILRGQGWTLWPRCVNQSLRLRKSVPAAAFRIIRATPYTLCKSVVVGGLLSHLSRYLTSFPISESRSFSYGGNWRRRKIRPTAPNSRAVRLDIPLEKFAQNALNLLSGIILAALFRCERNGSGAAGTGPDPGWRESPP
jgi:hypothetical protein